MTPSSSCAAETRAFSTPSETPAKTPREQLVTLEVRTEQCPQVLLRVLGLVSRDGSIPATIAFRRGDTGLEIEVELDADSCGGCERLVHRVEMLPMVREARLVRRGAGVPDPGKARDGDRQVRSSP